MSEETENHHADGSFAGAGKKKKKAISPAAK